MNAINLISGAAVILCVSLIPRAIIYFVRYRAKFYYKNQIEIISREYSPSWMAFLTYGFQFFISAVFIAVKFLFDSLDFWVEMFFLILAFGFFAVGIFGVTNLVGLLVSVSSRAILIKRRNSDIVLEASQLNYVLLSGHDILIGHSGDKVEAIPLVFKHSPLLYSQLHRLCEANRRAQP